LAVHFLRRAASRAGKRIAKFEEGAVDLLTRYSWPGNIRELQNVIERAVVLAEGETITVNDLPLDLQAGALDTDRGLILRDDRSGGTTTGKLGATGGMIEDDPIAERQALIEALDACGGNKARAARKLGIARSTYFSKLKKYGLADGSSAINFVKRLPR